jgi:hypothetical protein
MHDNKTETDLMSINFPRILTYKLTNTKSLKLNKEIIIIGNFHYLFKNIIQIFIDQGKTS